MTRDGSAQLTTVMPGHRKALEVANLQGLAAGDEIVLYAGGTLRDGTAIARR